MQLDRVRTKLGGKRNENLYSQTQLQPTREARAEDQKIRRTPIFMDEAYFTASSVRDTFACAVAR